MFKFAESSFAIFMQYVKVIDNLHKYLSKFREFPIPGHNSAKDVGVASKLLSDKAIGGISGRVLVY